MRTLALVVLVAFAGSSLAQPPKRVDYFADVGVLFWAKEGVAPKETNIAQPVYPPEMRRSFKDGRVEYEFSVARDGSTTGLKISATTNEDFKKAVEEAVRTWKFEISAQEISGKPAAILQGIVTFRSRG